MAGFTVKIEIQDRQAKSILMELRQRCEDTAPVMRIIGQLARTSIIKTFEVEGRPTPWKKSKRAVETGGKTLTKKSRLRNSILAPSAMEVNRDSVVIGTNVKYARIHNLGGDIQIPARDRVIHFKHKDSRNKNSPMQFTKANKKAKFALKVAGKAYIITMPKREYMMLQPEDWIEIRKALEEHLLSKR